MNSEKNNTDGCIDAASLWFDGLLARDALYIIFEAEAEVNCKP
jgi:hypothetical protein